MADEQLDVVEETENEELTVEVEETAEPEVSVEEGVCGPVRQGRELYPKKD